MKNKKALLIANFTVKVIIGVIALFVLIYLVGRLYGMFAEQNKLEQARGKLDEIFDVISMLEEGEQEEVLVLGPKDWYIVSYEEGEDSPEDCNGENCLCICDSTEPENCDDLGVCKNVNVQLQLDAITKFGGMGDDIDADQFYERTNPNSGKDGLTISVNNFILLNKIPISLFIKKNLDKIYISDMNIDTAIMLNFLNRKINFDGKDNMEDLIRENLFKKCLEEWDLSWWKAKFQTDKNLKKFVEEEAKKYINELIEKGDIKGGKIIFTATDKIWFYNAILIDEGDTDTCSVVEEKQICSNEIESERILRAYVRIYTC